MIRKDNKRLTEEEILKLKENIKELYDLKDNINFLNNDLSVLNVSDIFYLSCMTDISYHKIFSYLMYEYLENNNDLKKVGI